MAVVLPLLSVEGVPTMPFCHACGHENADTARFCNACGQQLPPATTATRQPAPPQQPAPPPPPPSAPPRLPPPSGPMPRLPNPRFRRFARTFLIVALAIAGGIALLVVVATCIDGAPDSPEATVAESTKEASELSEKATEQAQKAASESTKQAKEASQEATETAKEAEKEVQKSFDQKRKDADLPSCKDMDFDVKRIVKENPRLADGWAIDDLDKREIVGVVVESGDVRITCHAEAKLSNGERGWIRYVGQRQGGDTYVRVFPFEAFDGPESSEDESSSPTSAPTSTVIPTLAPEPTHKPTATPKPLIDSSFALPFEGSGSYKVGSDIYRGAYQTEGPSLKSFGSCIYAHLRKAYASIDDEDQVIEIYVVDGPAAVFFDDAYAEGFYTFNCKVWTPVEKPEVDPARR